MFKRHLLWSIDGDTQSVALIWSCHVTIILRRGVVPHNLWKILFSKNWPTTWYLCNKDCRHSNDVGRLLSHSWWFNPEPVICLALRALFRFQNFQLISPLKRTILRLLPNHCQITALSEIPVYCVLTVPLRWRSDNLSILHIYSTAHGFGHTCRRSKLRGYWIVTAVAQFLSTVKQNDYLWPCPLRREHVIGFACSFHHQ